MSDRFFDLSTYYQNRNVAIWKGAPVYNSQPPYHADTRFPEYLFNDISSQPNPAYTGVRKCLHLLGMDSEHYDQAEWNPLGEIIQPGDCVVIKPNFVLSDHADGGDLFSIITHPSTLRAVVDFVYIALKGQGQIIIADAPQMDCNFNRLLEITELVSICDYYLSQLNFYVQIIDLRSFWVDMHDNDGPAYTEKRRSLPGDPLGSTTINLGEKSAFLGKGSVRQLYGADYNRKETISHHHNTVQEYQVSRTILNADVLISVPKLKVHKKVGVTLNAKGLVGINTNKNCLVHYTLGTPATGGDQFPDQILSTRETYLIKTQRFLFDKLLARQNKYLDALYKGIRSTYRGFIKPWFGSVPEEKIILDGGNWYGNDSTWRMVYDLFHIALFADKDGLMQCTPQRKFFSFVDGIIAGENNGPLTPDAHSAGVLVAGFNPLAVDLTASRMMGFDWKKMKLFTKLLTSSRKEFQIGDPNAAISVHASEANWDALFINPEVANLHFTPHPGWKGHIELLG